ncbi:MAG: 6-chlorohydroxyquinol-1,2-dioxygenase [Actinomycetia bacterium]|nr:6-chlorohydroxyquinol-1,2-dioxygenase [Actinomycetes bacterium]
MNPTHAELLSQVLARYDHSPNPRLAEISRAAIRHLHAFVDEVRLQHDEWFAGVEFLTATGKICDDVRQEFILLSDTLGVSTLVEFITHDGVEGGTENTVLGPFHVPGSPERANGDSMLENDDAGDRVVIRGCVRNLHGEPLSGVKIDAWQNASTGFYACQQPGVQHTNNLRGVYRTDADGNFAIRTIRPVPYPIPDDGPAGKLLKDNGRNWWRPGHTHLWFTLEGHKQLITHLFDSESDYLTNDAVFGVRESLIRTFTKDASGELATTFDVVLEDA